MFEIHEGIEGRNVTKTTTTATTMCWLEKKNLIILVDSVSIPVEDEMKKKIVSCFGTYERVRVDAEWVTPGMRKAIYGYGATMRFRKQFQYTRMHGTRRETIF